uniref:ATP-binding cassette sub-family G member 1-like protein n=1 Tax=Sogatella furcifera TaxID=113103 RepID=A0A481P066_SOGFU|nr:ATP-binding cassette sub-family G member 1-like protein [Sogatella furcifera]
MEGINALNKAKHNMEFYNNNDYEQFSFPKRPTVDINFQDITYTVNTITAKKEILHGVSGEFRSGQLTAIMGPSGAGKSTLLNILAGYTLKGCQGSICINGINRKSRIEQFLKMSCYITQDDELRPLLTVREAMMLAAHLKLGFTRSNAEKSKQVSYILGLLGLKKHENTKTCRLSGGQRKRLSIALELLTNPPILFLDEPTTGLDSVSTTSCVSLLKNLAGEGHTIVCTIHQPTASMFEMFDHLYAIADGDCIYQGSSSNLLPFLSSLSLHCPKYHNPADFLIEVAVGEYDSNIKSIAAAAAKHGRQETTPYSEEIVKEENGLPVRVLQTKKSPAFDIIEYTSCLAEPPPFWYQVFHLLHRNFIITRRSKLSLALRMFMHIVISVMFGIIYNNVGNNANSVFGNYIYVYGTNLFLHYTGQMAVTLSFPLEFRVLRREHFNRWYSLLPYCVATLLIEIPFQIMCVIVYLVPSYLLTGQPLEWIRFLMFLMFTVAVCLTAQAFGFLVGATTPVTLAVFIGPVITAFLSVFGFAMKYNDIPSYLRVFYHISYFRSSFQGSLMSLYGNNRSYLPCLENGFHGRNGYCHYTHPTKFLREMEFEEPNPVFDVSYIVSVCLLVYMFTATAIWYRLNKR